MFEKIMVPLDGSRLAEVALPYAEELAGKLGSEIVLVHVRDYESCQLDESVNSYMQQIVERTAYESSKHVGKLVARKIKVSQRVLQGNPSEEMVRYADRQAIGLIVLATHGRTGISRWALGSVANRVVRYSSRPVILVRAKEGHSLVREQTIWRKILVPIDDSKKSQAILPYVEILAQKLKISLILFRVVENSNYVYGDSEWMIDMPFTDLEMEPRLARAKGELEDIADRLNTRGITAEPFVATGRPAEEIIRFSRESDADLVAMITHANSGIHRWVLGSVADKVLHGGSTPLLLLRDQQNVKEFQSEEAITVNQVTSS